MTWLLYPKTNDTIIISDDIIRKGPSPLAGDRECRPPYRSDVSNCAEFMLRIHSDHSEWITWLTPNVAGIAAAIPEWR